MQPPSGWGDAPRTSSTSWMLLLASAAQDNLRRSVFFYLLVTEDATSQTVIMNMHSTREKPKTSAKLKSVWTFHDLFPQLLLSFFRTFLWVWRWVMEELCSHKKHDHPNECGGRTWSSSGTLGPGAPGGPPLLHPWVRYLSRVASVNIQLCKWKANVK